tara:strand:+ start:427 stop:1197 length:771 start_codon:yes stop_codon:yes gene_type:complete
MDEITRQEYLRNMGIQSYFPRYVLPGSLSTEQCEWPELAEPDSGLTERPAEAEFSSLKAELKTAQKTEQQTAHKSELKPGLPLRPGPQEIVEPVSDENAVSSHVEADNNEIRFQLAFIQVNDAMLALILLPHVRASNSLSQVHKQLFSNICTALNQQIVDLNFGIKPFSWPFGESIHMDKSEAAAKTALGAYLAQLRDVFKYRHLMVMGENMLRLVTAEADCEITVCRSLDEMLKMPQLKREVWQQLKRSKLTRAD